ncbi:class I adenylate-forming enzyme family protein [Pimelobacter simplex]|uniref:class I adenylate-forming enzyme family protein n=1 Tax=Nocardioides simplex TaxID=2045 RepID=UPI00193159C1|nr:acyl--CoA ligase [Pimelobacter simplex]
MKHPEDPSVVTRDEATARLTAPNQPFELRCENVRGRQMDVFVNRQRTLGELLRGSAAFSDRDYLVTESSRLTFAQHLDAVAAVSVTLRDDYGVRKGDRVAICAANSPEWIVAFWAITSLGAVAVGMNSQWARQEIAHGLELTSPRVVIADAPRRELIHAATQSGVLSIEDDLPSIISRNAGVPLPDEPADLGEDDPAVILFTSGTSGRAKGATHSHRNVIGAVWLHLLNDAIAAEMGAVPSERRWLLATPLFHIAALHNLAVVRAVTGDTAVMHTGRFDIDGVLRLIERERVTNWGAVPTMAARLVEHAERHGLDAYDLSSLRSLTLNAAPSSASLKERVRSALPIASQNMGTSYGMTESSTAATLASGEEVRANPETVGRPIPLTQLVVRDQRGLQVPDGVEGEIWLRGPLIMIGYWGDPDATAGSFDEDGWFRTGDLGSFHDGRLQIASRRSDLILRGGENIYPAEIESALEEHPKVRECVAIGLPHPEWGQEVGAVVVVASDSDLSPENLRHFLSDRLARYKVPTRWHVTTEVLPRNATGKVVRRLVSLD